MFFAPFAEEVIFRGFLLGGLMKWFPAWAAVLISGALFGAVHGQQGVIIPIAMIGILLAVVYLRANSIFASMGTHFLFNTVSFLATYVGQLMER
jgi:membrane protease YdiL (CAAX protease family)